MRAKIINRLAAGTIGVCFAYALLRQPFAVMKNPNELMTADWSVAAQSTEQPTTTFPATDLPTEPLTEMPTTVVETLPPTDTVAGVAAVLTEAVLLDNQAPFFELLQSRVNGFYLDTALLGN